MTAPLPIDTVDVSVCVCTRNRGTSVTHTIESILENHDATFELILIDQSTNDETAEAVQLSTSDSRFRYVRSNTVGTGRSRNIALAESRGAIVVYTDDDCSVPPNWVETMASLFEDERVGMAFCNVLPGPHDSSAGFIPAYEVERDFVATSVQDKVRARGIGAGMAVRRAAALGIGGFDEMLGPGAPFPDCEDGDLAARMLLSGWRVRETSRVAILHNGFRTWKEGRELAKRNAVGIGAAYSKPIRVRKWRFVSIVLYEGFVPTLWTPMLRVLNGRKPQGLRRFLYFWYGFLLGLRAEVDPRHIVFVNNQAATDEG